MRPESIGFKDIPEKDRGRFFIRNLDPDGRFSGNRRFYANICHSKIKFNIILQADDPAYLYRR